jgi:hypothetical protein
MRIMKRGGPYALVLAAAWGCLGDSPPPPGPFVCGPASPCGKDTVVQCETEDDLGGCSDVYYRASDGTAFDCMSCTTLSSCVASVVAKCGSVPDAGPVPLPPPPDAGVAGDARSD